MELVSPNYSPKNYRNCLECCGPLFLLKKKSTNFKNFPTITAKESALIPIVKNQMPEYKISQ
jgi:hypothetical protein